MFREKIDDHPSAGTFHQRRKSSMNWSYFSQGAVKNLIKKIVDNNDSDQESINEGCIDEDFFDNTTEEDIYF